MVLESLFPMARRELLATLFLSPGEAFHLRDLARRLRTGHGILQRELAQLVKVGVLAAQRQDRRVLYQVNPESFVYSELLRLIEKTAGPTGRIHDALLPLAPSIQVAFIYGSIAARTAKASSDVDLMVVGPVTFGEVTEVLSPVQETIQREINPTVYPVEEFRTKITRGSSFLRTILERPKDFVLGDSHVLEGLV